MFKVRWVVEAANARIKRWKYLDHVLPTTQIPYIGDLVRIVCAVCNKYCKPLNATSCSLLDELTAERMLNKLQQGNDLQTFIEENNLSRHNATKWEPIEETVNDFPRLDDTTLQLLTLGTYQLRLSSSYIQEYTGNDSKIYVLRENNELIKVKLQSRHVSSKSYIVWIQYDSDHVKGWYCQCRSGARTVGTCSHVAAVLWYLSGLSGNTDKCGVKDWGSYVEDASCIPQPVDSSESESDASVIEE